jgi:monofunctional glycosyltransferase
MGRRHVFLLLLLASSAGYVFWLPDVSLYKKKNPATTAYIELRKKKLGPKFKPVMIWTPWEKISENLKDAVLVAEDDTFYRHGGVDWDAVRVAFAKDWEQKRLAYGASTITQQVARNLFLSPSKNPLRKFKELLIAYRLEKVLGKRRIFELYLNIAEWGKGIYGCEAAAQAYFGKSAADLTVDEAVAMAVVLPSPRRLDPAKRGKYVERNSARVLARMQASGMLPEPEEGYDVAESTETAAQVGISTETLFAVGVSTP